MMNTKKIVKFLKPYWTETRPEDITVAINETQAKWPGDDLFIPKPAEMIICPDAAGDPWRHNVLTGIYYDNSLFGYPLIWGNCFANITKNHTRPVTSINVSLDNRAHEEFCLLADATKQDFLRLLATLNSKQIDMIVGWAKKHSKRERFYGHWDNNGDVSLILNTIKEFQKTR